MSKKIELKKDDIKKFYIEENHSIDECCEIFKVSRTTFKNNLKVFGIHKDAKLATTCSQNKLRKKYGENYSPLADREKIKATLTERYGCDNPMKNSEIRKKAEETNLKKYGVRVPIQNQEIFNKMVNTNLEKYGAKSSLGSAEIRKKAKDTCIKLYGDTYPLRAVESRDALLEKRKKTNLKKYGSEEITKSEHFKNIVRERCMKKYGTASPNESVYSQTTFKDLESFKNYLTKFEYKPTINDIKKDLSLSDTYLLKKIHTLKANDYVNLKPHQSSYEKEIIDFLISNGIDEEDILRNSKNIIKDTSGKPLEIDIYIQSIKLGIEFNGTYWHSSIYKESSYHKNKSLLCEAKGIRLIHIYEYEWVDEKKKNIIKSIILNALGKTKSIIYARKCELRVPTDKETKDFLNENHLQGYRCASKKYALYYNNEIVQIMTLSKHNKYEWEIIREVSKLNTLVVGGGSKLINYFISQEKPKSIFSYCDFNKFTGNGYSKIGMKFIGYTVPDMKWIIDGKVVNRNPSKNSILKNSATCQIFGAGSKKYLITF